LLLSKSADATSVVVQLGPNRIVLAADTRGTKLNRGSTSVEDAECKIVPLGNAAFAVTGNEDYVPNQQNDQIASWNSRSDARMAYTEQNGNLTATLDDWIARAKQHYSSFYTVDPIRVRQLAGKDNVLLVGFFLGFQDDKAVLLAGIIYFDERAESVILDKKVVVSQQALYSSNATTQELIDGQSERARAANTVWLAKAKSIPISARMLRRVEYLIQFTSNYDPTVGTRVDVLEVFQHKSPRWLQNFTCPTVK